jgi:hypothetical protein
VTTGQTGNFVTTSCPQISTHLVCASPQAYTFILNGSGNSINGRCFNSIINGRGNSILPGANGVSGDVNTIINGDQNTICTSFSRNVILGGASSLISCGTFDSIFSTANGTLSTASYSTILGGSNNCGCNVGYSAILGGLSNLICNSCCSATFGEGNRICSSCGSFAVGINNSINFVNYAVVLGCNITASSSNTTYVNNLCVNGGQVLGASNLATTSDLSSYVTTSTASSTYAPKSETGAFETTGYARRCFVTTGQTGQFATASSLSSYLTTSAAYSTYLPRDEASLQIQTREVSPIAPWTDEYVSIRGVCAITYGPGCASIFDLLSCNTHHSETYFCVSVLQSAPCCINLVNLFRFVQSKSYFNVVNYDVMALTSHCTSLCPLNRSIKGCTAGFYFHNDTTWCRDFITGTYDGLSTQSNPATAEARVIGGIPHLILCSYFNTMGVNSVPTQSWIGIKIRATVL